MPSPGGARIRALSSRLPSNSDGSTSSAAPGNCRATRTAAEDSFRMVRTAPSSRATVPHSPTRCPPWTVRYPRLSWSSTAWTEARLASSSSCSSSCWVTGGPASALSPSGSTAAIGSPTRSRSSSIWLRRSSGRDITPLRRRRGRTRAACSTPDSLCVISLSTSV